MFRIDIESKEKDESRRLSIYDRVIETLERQVRQREAANINKPLLTFTRVIKVLATPGGDGQSTLFREKAHEITLKLTGWGRES
ncbi:hypothetical protein PsorP6_000622 [Peronosclerospora sorghi]|uniref:Uncharacterized protein n=1 Tax=Peronosclerospora sorghi TaxID=230839 RepID=A0ACC0WUR0_9STRA|nr:hypothetical protein PsorP6_000622 [Peronosclerospora sorghi]